MLWGIDLGGTKIEGAILDPTTNRLAARKRIPTGQWNGYGHIVSQMGRLVALMEEETGIRRSARIGIGTPGAFDPQTQCMKNCNTTCLNGSKLPYDVEKELGVPIEMANDANCFALAEATLGAARGFPTVFGVILGTGVGGGLVVDGKVLNGCHGIAGEWGHNVLDASGPDCYCGKSGCVEKFLSGPACESYYTALTGKKLTLAQISEKATEGDTAAHETVSRLCKFFGQAIATVMNIFDPHAVVIGGGVGNIEALYREGREAILPWLFNPRLSAPILRPLLGDSAGVLGAALLTQPQVEP